MIKINPYLLSVFSGLLLGLVWNSVIPILSIYFAFVPIILIIQNPKISYRGLFNLVFLSFIIFHLLTVWWLYKSSIPGFLTIIFLNSTFMAAVILVSFITFKLLGNHIGLISFILYWLSFEYIHYHWEFSWPFMNLGNWLGQIPVNIQWYEYTGVLGGTLWILLVNAGIFLTVKSLIASGFKSSIIYLSLTVVIIIFPIIFSRIIYLGYKEAGCAAKVKIIQPNIDPFAEKYNSKLFNQQIEYQINMAILDSSGIVCFLFPESSFPVYLDENDTGNNLFLKRVKSKLVAENKSVLGGLYSFRSNGTDTLFFNTAFMMNSNLQIYHKSKLVIGVEKMPFQQYLKFLKNWNFDFGGYSSSLTSDDQRKVFYSLDSNLRIAPVICYESVYGEFVAEYIKNGSTSIAVITNDGWWGKTPGYRQHLMHSQLRAIETRKSIVRAANTGTSCFIDQKGEIVSQSKAFEKNYLIGSIYQNNQKTFYVRNGDYIGMISLYCSILLLGFTVFVFVKRKTEKKGYQE